MNALWGGERADRLREKIKQMQPGEREVVILGALSEAPGEMGATHNINTLEAGKAAVLTWADM